MITFRALVLAGTAFTLINSTGAWAQEAGTEQATESGPRVADIIVTAQKRDERLQDVPVAVTAVSDAQLEAASVKNVMELSLVAPSLKSVASNGIYLSNSIRGIGSLAYGAGVESPVGLFVDGVYQAAPFSFSTQLNNISSVEVLKGPQGTLFGRNATGGLINIRTSDPQSVPSGKVSLSYGNYDMIRGEAYFSGGVSDDLAADIAAISLVQGKGFGRNLVTGRDWNKVDHNVALRSKWVWTPGSGTTVKLIGDYFDGKGSNGANSGVPGMISGWTGNVFPDLGYDNLSDVETTRTVEGGGVSLQVEQEFGAVAFNSISAYRTSRYSLLQDLDYEPVPYAAVAYYQKDRQISQEFQLSSIGASKLKWTVGLFYFDAKVDSAPTIHLEQFPFVGARFDYLDTVTTRSYAAYGQGTYALGESTNLTLGLRYTNEKRKEKDASLNIVFAPTVIVPVLYPDRSSTENKVTYRASLDHRFSPELMAYASVNTGFKSGGFNATAPGEAPYRSETLTAYEVGIKSDLFDRRFRLNISGFYYDYKDIQVQRLLNNQLFLINGPKAEIYGVDADFYATLSEEISLSGGATWLSPKFKQFLGCPESSPMGGVPLTTVGTDCSGNQLPLASKFTASGAVNYSKEIGSGRLDLSTNIYYNRGYFFEADNILHQKSYALLGATANYTFDSGITVGVYGKNLTNKQIVAFAINQANGTPVEGYQEPRTYGVTLGFKF